MKSVLNLLFLLLFFISGLDAIVDWCNDDNLQTFAGTYGIPMPDGKCYISGDTLENFDFDATRMLLTEEDAQFPIIRNQRNLDMVLNIASVSLFYASSFGAGPGWVGMKCTSNTVCNWVDDGSTVNFTYFQPGSPDISVGNCIKMTPEKPGDSRWLWYSENCANAELTTGVFQKRSDATTETHPGMCSIGYDQGHNGWCHMFNAREVTAEMAQASCAMDGANMISIVSMQENDRLTESLQDFVPLDAWIGLMTTNGINYTWNDGTPFAYSNFADGYPNAAMGNCVAISGTRGPSYGKWKNVNCNTPTLPFYCKNEPLGGIANVANGCPAPRYVSYGEIASSGWPSNYGNNLNCTYVITAPFDFCQPNVFFNDFQTDPAGDFVYIYDGPTVRAPLLIRLGGNAQLGAFYNATGQSLTIQFRSDPSGARRGWQAVYGYCCTTKTNEYYCFNDMSSTRRNDLPEELAKLYGNHKRKSKTII